MPPRARPAKMPRFGDRSAPDESQREIGRRGGTRTSSRALRYCYAALMEGSLQLAVSNRLPCTRAGANRRSCIGGYRDTPAGRLLSCELV